MDTDHQLSPTWHAVPVDAVLAGLLAELDRTERAQCTRQAQRPIEELRVGIASVAVDDRIFVAGTAPISPDGSPSAPAMQPCA